MRTLTLIAVVTLLAACSTDWLPFSGGQLSGTEQPAPESWVEVAAQDIVQLETVADEPYSVNIWVIGKPTHLYVFAGDNRATWVEHIEANPNVRMGIGDSIYRLRATRVADADEFEAFAGDWEAKYGNRPRNENVQETYLLRLTPRN